MEYRTEIITRHDGETYETKHETELMNKLGKEGWLLASTATMGHMVYGYFIRPNNNKPTVS